MKKLDLRNRLRSDSKQWRPLILFLIVFVVLAFSAVPLIFSLPIITATKSDALLVDNDADGVADPGDTIRYTTIITNAGTTDATNAGFLDTIDANTTLVAGSLKTTPIARHDSYASIGNVGITVPAGSGVLANDNDPDGTTPTLTIVSPPTTSTFGGDVALAADGSFTYSPPAGFEGADSFSYTVQDSDNNQDPATVFIAVSDVFWFINNSAAGGGDGRLGTPFNSVTAYNTTAADEAGDIIFLHTGSGSYTAGITLLANQMLIGQGAAASLASITSITPPTHSNALPTTGGARPLITNAGGSGITLNSGNLLRGLNIGSALTGLSGSSVGSITVSEMAIDTGAGTAVNISSGVLGVTLDSVSSSSAANVGISLQNTTGSFTVLGSGTPGSGGTIAGKMGGDGSTTVGIGIYLNNVTNIAFNDMQLNDFQNFGILGTGVAGFTFADSVINTTSGVNGNAASPHNEGSMRFTNLTGTVSFSNATIASGYDRVVLIQNTNAANLAMTVSNSTISDSQSAATTGDTGLEIDFMGSSTGSVSVSGSSFLRNRTTAVQIFARDSAYVDVDLKSSTFDPGTGIGRGPEVAVEDNATLTFEISNNTTVKSRGGAAIVAVAVNNATMEGRIENNSNIDLNGNTGAGILVKSLDGADTKVSIKRNRMALGTEAFGGIRVRADEPTSGGSATLHATIDDNTINLGSATFGRAIQLIDDGGNFLCANINGNSVIVGTGSPEIGISVIDQSGTAIQFQGLSASAAGGAGTVGALDVPWLARDPAT